MKSVCCEPACALNDPDCTRKSTCKLRSESAKFATMLTWDADDCIYVVKVIGIDNCVSHGATIDQAIEMGREAAEICLLSDAEHARKQKLRKAKKDTK